MTNENKKNLIHEIPNIKNILKDVVKKVKEIKSNKKSIKVQNGIPEQQEVNNAEHVIVEIPSGDKIFKVSLNNSINGCEMYIKYDEEGINYNNPEYKELIEKIKEEFLK